MRYFIEFSFDGTNYSGWQKQKNSVTVQSVLEECLSKLLKNNIKTYGCCRTDAGVHARQFFAHFDVDNIIDVDMIQYKLNLILPHDIAIKKIFLVNEKIHARYSALKRTYVYYLLLNKDPFLIKYSFPVYKYKKLIELKLLEKYCEVIRNTKDFTSFTKSKGGQKNNICKIYECYFKNNNNLLEFWITSNRFTRGMVRFIVGTLLKLMIKNAPVNELVKIIEMKNNKFALQIVPANGLFLERVEYTF